MRPAVVTGQRVGKDTAASSTPWTPQATAASRASIPSDTLHHAARCCARQRRREEGAASCAGKVSVLLTSTILLYYCTARVL